MTSPSPEPLPGVSGPIILTPRQFTDERGYFSETYSQAAFAAAGLRCAFIQDNQSLSRHRGTIRGLHFQIPPFAQAKLVRVLSGAVFDVAVDLRAGSPTFGKHGATVLSADNHRQLFIPAGFAHGFCTLADDTVVLYKVDAAYSPEHEQGVLWSDPALAIDWPVATEKAILSPKDGKLPLFGELLPSFTYSPTH